MNYQLKTQQTDASVEQFLGGIQDMQKRQDCYNILEICQHLTGEEGKMWGKNIIGFGRYHYTYASGQEGDWMRIGFAPRAAGISLYLTAGYEYGNIPKLLEKLGKYKLWAKVKKVCGISTLFLLFVGKK